MRPSLFWVSFPSGSCGGPSEPDGAAAKARLPFKRQQKRMHLIWEVLGGEGNGNRSLREPWWSETCWSRSVAHLVLCLFPAWLMFSGCWRAFVELLSFSYSAHSSQSIKPVKVSFALWLVVLGLCELAARRFWVWLPQVQLGVLNWDFSSCFLPVHKHGSSVGLVMCPIALGDFNTPHTPIRFRRQLTENG